MRASKRWLLVVALVIVGAVAGVAAASYARPAATEVATLKADYWFQNSRLSSVAGAPALADLTDPSNPVANAFGKETVAGKARTVLQFPKGNGVALSPTTGVIPNDHYTIVALFRFQDGGVWRRIADFHHGTDETGVYANPADALSFFGFPCCSGPPGMIPANTYVQVALTRDTAGIVRGYVNGAEQYGLTDTDGRFGVIDTSNVLRLFRDNEGGTEHSAGAVARIRLYDDALSASQIAALPLLPPKPTLTLTPTHGSPGSPVHVDGANFGPSEKVKVVFIDGTTLAKTTLGTKTTDAPGSFAGDFTIPANASNGTNTIKATGVTSKLKKTATFTVP